MSNIYTDCADAAIIAARSLEFQPDVPLFKTVARWQFQIESGSGGVQAFRQFAPFCFIHPTVSVGQLEGDCDLNAPVGLSLMIGQSMEGRSDDAMYGDANTPGIFDIIIGVMKKFHHWHPNNEEDISGIAVDGFKFVSCFDQVDNKHKQVYFQMNLESKCIIDSL